jgi:hypothetical protein
MRSDAIRTLYVLHFVCAQIENIARVFIAISECHTLANERFTAKQTIGMQI